jgi:hypothetical protein
VADHQDVLDLELVVTGREDMGDAYRRALEGMAERWRAKP